MVEIPYNSVTLCIDFNELGGLQSDPRSHLIYAKEVAVFSLLVLYIVRKCPRCLNIGPVLLYIRTISQHHEASIHAI